MTTYSNSPENGIETITIDSMNHVFLGTSGAGIYFSTDNCLTWQRKDIGANNPVTCIIVESDGTLLATSCNNGSETGDGIFISSDDGVSWTSESSGISDLAVWSVIQSSGADLFAGTYHDGVFHSADNGNSWCEWNTGLSSFNVRNFSKCNNGYLYAGTNNGVYRSVESISSIEEVSQAGIHLLDQNFPNPFDRFTVIRYTIPEALSGEVIKLSVFDLLGRSVLALPNQRQAAGTYEVTCNLPAANQNTGGTIYICELKVGNQTERIRMTCVAEQITD